MHLGRLRGRALAWQARGDAKARQPDLPSRLVDEHMGRLEVLVEQAPPVELAQRGRQPAGEAQPLRQRQRATQEARQRLAPRVREHQHGPPLMLRERQRLHGPGGVERRP